MPGILTYALHYEGEFNKNSLGAVAEASKLAGELGGEASVLVLGEGIDDSLAASLGKYGAAKVYKVEGPEGLAQPVVDAMAKVMTDNDIQYALFGGGLLGFEIGAGLAARLDAGVCMEVTNVRVEDGKLVAERPILQDSQISSVHYRSKVGVIIGRLNAFEVRETGGSATVEQRDGIEGIGPVTAQSDVYSLGVVLYQGLTGRVPFEGDPFAVLDQVQHGDPPPPTQFRPDLDRAPHCMR